MKSYLWDMTDEEIEEEYWQNEIARAVDENTKKVSEEKSLSIALKLLEGGQLSIADIARYTGVPIERIEAKSCT